MRHTGKKVNARKSVKFVAAYLGQSHVPVRCPQQCPPASRMSHRIPNPRPSSAQITITIGRAAHNLKTHVEKKQREKFRGSIGRNLDHEWLCVCVWRGGGGGWYVLPCAGGTSTSPGTPSWPLGPALCTRLSSRQQARAQVASAQVTQRCPPSCN